MWVIIGAVAALLIAVLYFLFNHKKEAAPDFALTNSTAAAGAGGAGAGAAEEDDTDKIKLTLYFGSQTGTAEGFAKTLANESRRAGFKPHIVDLEDFEADDFVADAQEGAMVMFLMATYGEGEPTDNAAEFYEWLKDRDGQLEEGCLQGLKFTVFGLGNRQYEHYNAMGRFVAKRLNALGASEVFASGDGDDDGTLDDDFAAWKETLWPGMQKAAGIAVSDAGATAAGAAPLENLEWDVEMLRTVPSAEEVREAHRAVLPGSVKISSRYYFTSTPAKVVVNRELRKAGEGSTRHLEIDIRGLSLTYTSADNLGVCPENDPEAVEALGRWMGYDLDAWFTLRRTDTEEGRAAKPLFPTPCTVREALSRYCDFNGTVRKDFLGQLANFATKDADKERLVHLASSGGKEAFREEIHNPKLSMFEVFEKFGSCRVPLARLLQMLPRLQPRLYTICSSNKVNPSRIHAVVSVVQEKLPGDKHRVFNGVCSNYMARRLPPVTIDGKRTDGGESKSANARGPWPTMMVHVRPSTFNLPSDPSVPVVMVGPGTGVAPMRAFLQERRWQREQGHEVGDTVLFFGCRRSNEDFIYEDEMNDFLRDGTLTAFPLAFSRETPGSKVYVQNKLAEHKDLVWQLIHEGRGHFYVCGGTHMGNDVQAALEAIAEEQLAPATNGRDYVKTMHDEGRYVAELWS